MTIQEKALKLAILDGWKLKDKKYKGYLRIKNNKEWESRVDFQLYDEYSSFNRLMELFSDINKNSFKDLWFINIDAFYILLKNVNKGLVINFEYNRNGITLKEALMDCLLKYYELTKGE